MTHRSSALALAAICSVTLVVSAPPSGAAPSTTATGTGGDTVAAKEAEARRVELRLKDLGRQAEVLVERYREAEQELANADAALLAARTRLDGLRRQLDDARARAQEHVVALYQGRLRPSPFDFVDARDVLDVGVRVQYATAVTGRDLAAVADLVKQHRAVRDEQASLQTAREAVAARERGLASRRRAAEDAAARQRALRDRVQGELATLVAREAARRRAAEEQAARDAMARRQAEARQQAREPASLPAAVPAAVPAPSPDPRARTAVSTALAQLGKPYQWGGNGPDAFDCSGLTSYAWRAAGVSLPRSAASQYEALPHVSLEQLVPGDLLFFGNPIHHEGMYLGEGRMVNAPFTGAVVRIDSIYRLDFAGASRPG